LRRHPFVLLKFTKMQGAGNDFVVLDCTRERFSLSREQLRKLADRHFGVGCDQVLVVEGAKGADFRYRIFNADGGEVEQCGNGARCFVKFVHGKGLTDKREIRVETLGGTIVPRLEADGEVPAICSCLIAAASRFAYGSAAQGRRFRAGPARAPPRRSGLRAGSSIRPFASRPAAER
jgi:diaminopimelate epimerase